jgi:hypothetical protein
MKHIQILLIIFLIIGTLYASHNKRGSSSNIYKDDLKTKHSLFREKDDMERMSVEYTGIPELKNKYNNHNKLGQPKKELK